MPGIEPGLVGTHQRQARSLPFTPRWVLPLDLVGPVGGAHLSLRDVLRMTGLERSLTLRGLTVTRHALLPKPDRLHLVAIFGDNDM